MYVETGERHHRPHIHVYYQGNSASYTIDTIELIAGSLLERQARLVKFQ
jgi:hypothetical protein